MLFDLEPKDLFGIIAFTIGFIAGLIYIRAMILGTTKPHIYTIAVWTILLVIAFFAQLTEDQGIGTWTLGISTCISTLIFCLSFKYGTKDRTKLDILFLILSLSAIIPWIVTKDPFWSVVLIIIIDALAYIPTFRKCWNDPYSENLLSYNLHNVKFLLSIAALDVHNFITIGYVLAVIIFNYMFIGFCVFRQSQMKKLS
jgi:hypothetical protein